MITSNYTPFLAFCKIETVHNSEAVFWIFEEIYGLK